MFLIYKRLFDLIISITILIITFPIIFTSMILILIFDLQNPLFFQERSGINGKRIKIIKLQTMKSINGEKKITKIGNILRLSKIDELPQLISVLKNDMSFIGPRPLYLDFNKFYKNNHKFRITVKPGITGLAQVKVKDNTDWNKKFNFDIIYIKKANFNLDFYIFFKTFITILNSVIKKKARIIESIDYKKNFYNNYCK